MSATSKKISIRVWRTILDKLEKKMDAACLRRDAYLNKILAVELGYLDTEVAIANSIEAHAFVAKRFDQLDTKPVSLTLRSDLVERLNDICARKRIVRDAFFNRLFLLLAATSKQLDHLLGLDKKWREQLLRHYQGDYLHEHTWYPIDEDLNPFREIRDWINYERSDNEGIYTFLWDTNLVKNTDLTGLNCYMSDERIPDHPAEVARRELNDLILNALG